MTTFAQTRSSGIDPRQTSGVTIFDFGAIAASDSDCFIKAATSTELPNDDSIVYSFPVAEADQSPQDGVNQTGILSTPRNIAVTTSTAAAETVVSIVGTDMYGVAMSEDITIAQGDSSGAGLKAFATISSITIASGGDITTDTINIGTGDAIGLPYRLTSPNHAIFMVDGLLEPQSTGFELVLADSTSPATSETGDVRGTVAFTTANAPNAARSFSMWMIASDASEVETYGVDQA